MTAVTCIALLGLVALNRLDYVRAMDQLLSAAEEPGFSQ
jgi:hypothetical protein